MSVQVKGSGTIGGLDEGLVVSGIVTSSTQINVGSNIKLGNAGVVTATSFVGSGANLTSLPAQATIANNADNRVITGGSGVNLNAESNVLYDGTNFGIGKSPSRTLDVQGKIRSSDSVCFGDNSSTPSEGAAIHRPAASSLAFVTNNTEKLRITSGGFIGAGTANPRRHFHLHNSATATVGFQMTNGGTGESNDSQGFQLKVGSDSHAEISQMENSDLRIFTNASERLRIDSSGRLLIGTTLTDNRDGYNSAVQIAGTGGDDSSMCIGRYSANVSYPALILSKSRNGTINNHTRINTGDYLGGIQFQGDDGTRFLVGASIVAQAASPVADYDMATDLVFSTNYGTTSPTKSMTLDQQGRLIKPNQPSFAAFQSQSSWTVSGTMVFNSTRHNVGNHYSTSNGHFTAPVSGSYQFNFYSIYKGNHTSGWVSLYKNNARMIGGDIHFTFYDLGNNWDNVSFSQVLYLSENDYVEMKSAQSTTWHGNNWQCFSGYLLG